MSIAARLHYYQRIFGAYLLPGNSHVSFWHDVPQLNPNASISAPGEYYMPFTEKADYAGPFDADGIPMLDYGGRIGVQYNPIAITQWGLGNYNLFRRQGEERQRRKVLAACDWLCVNLEQNSQGVPVWNHYFDWEYRSRLQSPWYSGLAQGQGISLLVRAYYHFQELRYLDTAERAFASFQKCTAQGGVSFTDAKDNLWFEEYVVSPPTHILNGFIWAMWGVYDYLLATHDPAAKDLFSRAVQTLRSNLQRYDLGFWSLYEQSGTWLPMLASPFYHRLHIVQLRVTRQLTGDEVFSDYADRWENYARSRSKRTRALCYKSAFKLCYY
ncbi:MAG: hypothetical protein DMG88_13830 [Acidobacteria bacterium]|nr:MAG: hypothetical protein DMG88_13830 [Acidobacteriota bacterium]